ncbi:MAG: hypothetical protein ACRC8J_00955 [Phocaeicola sp.]
MDKIVAKIAALGVPSLVLIIAISATGLYGAAAITTALAVLGPFGILGGIATLGVIGLISDAIAEFGISAIFSGVVAQLLEQGETKDSIIAKAEKYPISKSLKRKLKEQILKA